MSNVVDNAPPNSSSRHHNTNSNNLKMHQNYCSGGKATPCQLPSGHGTSTSSLGKSLPATLLQPRCPPSLPDPRPSTSKLLSPSASLGRRGGATSAAATSGFKPSQLSAQTEPGRGRRGALALQEELQGRPRGGSRRRRRRPRSKRGSA